MSGHASSDYRDDWPAALDSRDLDSEPASSERAFDLAGIRKRELMRTAVHRRWEWLRRMSTERPFTRVNKLDRKHQGLFLAAVSAAAILSACIPLPRMTPGISDQQLTRIEMGITKDAEVKALLGQPNIIWETERIWVYKERPSGAFLWVIPTGPYTAAIFMTELGDDVIIMRFDGEGRIERLQRRAGSILPLTGKFLRSWLSEKAGESGSGEKHLSPRE